VTNVAKNVVTLYIDDTSIRLLVTRGKRIRKGAEVPVEPGLIEGAVVIKEAEVAAKVKQFLKEQKIETKKVIVGLSGLLCLTRAIILPQVPKAMLAEAVMREAQRVLPLSTDEFYISWNTTLAPKGKIQVFLTAVRCRSADAMLKMLRSAGLKPYAMDIKPLALSRLVREESAVIVDVQPTEFDVIIMANGIPHPIRTVAFPSEGLTWQEKFPMIRDDVDRTINFYNSNNLGEPITPNNAAIYVSGELVYQPELCKSLSNELGYTVLPLSSPLKPPKKPLDSTRYMVNIGLALKEPSLEKNAGPSLAGANLLPAAYQPKPISWGKVVAVPSALAIMGMLIPMVMLVQGASYDIGSLRNQLDNTKLLFKQKLLEKQQLNENIAALEERLAEAEAARDTIAAALDSLEQLGSKINGDLGVTIDLLPDGMMLTGASHVSDTLTINGRAPSQAEVLSYAQSLADSTRFSEVIVASVRSAGSGDMDFTLILKTKGLP